MLKKLTAVVVCAVLSMFALIQFVAVCITLSRPWGMRSGRPDGVAPPSFSERLFDSMWYLGFAVAAAILVGYLSREFLRISKKDR